MFGRSKKKNIDTHLPSTEVELERYQGRPLLVVLENYVLDCIGVLTEEKQQEITRMVQSVWGGAADWKKTVREQLQLGDSIDESFRQMWGQNQKIASQQGVDLTSVQFAKMVVDQNFSELIEQ